MSLLPPGGLFEIVFSFDTTGSMSRCIQEVRTRIQDMIQRLQADIPAIRIAVIAHGDYCDKHIYVTKFVDFTDDVAKLCEFVRSVESTGGGDSDECYELVLHQVNNDLSWTPGSNRVLVMIGDANPHAPDYRDNTLKICWKAETNLLACKKVKIYAVQCFDNRSDNFYKTMAEMTSGHHLKLKDFSNMFDFLMAICYRERGDDLFQVYEKEVRSRCLAGDLHNDLHGLFSALHSDADTDKTVSRLKTSEKRTKPVAPKKLTKKVWDKGPEKDKLRLSGLKPKTKKLVIKNKNIKRELLRRENVPENNFILNDLHWSPWIKVISPNKADDTFVKRRGNGRGYRKETIFQGKTTLPALYEVSVQTRNRTRRHVVLRKFARHLPKSVTWESRLLGRFDVRRQVDEVIRRGCCVFVRRVILRRQTYVQKTSSFLSIYDYAWMKNSRKTHHRSVVKGEIKISDDLY